MANEDRRYTAWIHTQPCAACGTRLQVQVHHALYGTTYSPEETRPSKAIEGARRGGAQRSHDYFSLPMCLKCHIPGIHELGGFFDGWTREEANAWEAEQVASHRNRYAMQAPPPAAVPEPGRQKRSRNAASDVVARERSRIVEYIRDRAGEARLKPNEAALLTDLASEIEAQQTEHF